MTEINRTDFATPGEFTLHGRHVVVTGAGRGLGRSMALSAAAFGAHVTAVARTKEQLAETVEAASDLNGSVRSVAADLSHLDRLEALVDEIDGDLPIDGVIHAAGIQRRVDALEVTDKTWREVMTLNLDAPFFLSTHIARRQAARSAAGSHVFIGSLNSSIGLPRNVPYVASKTGILGVTRALSTEWSGRGIRVNAIGPGYYRTALTEDLLNSDADHSRIMSRIPMKRLGDPKELGGAAVFLLSDASSYVSGQMINVDGGWLGS